MAKTKVPFYFVLYLVVLVELLAVIIERDNTEIELKARLKEYETIQDSVISLYKQPVSIHIQEETDWIITENDSLHILVSVSNLQTPEERASVLYFVEPLVNEGRYSYSLYTDTKTGYGHFYFKTKEAGTYSFNVFSVIKRKLPSYLPAIVLEGIFTRIGNDFTTFSDTVNFKIKAKIQLDKFDRPGRG